MSKPNENRTAALILIGIGIVPVIWAALIVAPFLSEGLTGIVEGLASGMREPISIQWCADSPKSILLFLLMYLYTAIAPIPLSTFAGEPTSHIGKTFLKSYAAVCLEGAIIVLGCIIFSVFTANPPAVDASASATTMVWSYLGELIFNLLVLTGTIKMADRVVREMFGL